MHRAYISGVDQAAWPTRIEIGGNELLCRRQNSDSGKLNVAWPVPGFGRPMLPTASLPEREEAYLLAVELARGKIVQVRNQLAIWQSAGMTIPDEFVPSAPRGAPACWRRRSPSRTDPAAASEIAQQAIVAECQAAEILTRSYVDAAAGGAAPAVSAVADGAGVQPGRQPAGAPAAAAVSRRPSTARRSPCSGGTSSPKKETIAGRLTTRRSNGRWPTICCFAADRWSICRRTACRRGCRSGRTTTGTCRASCATSSKRSCRATSGKIRIWEVAARANAGGALALTEENRLTLVAKILEVARQVDPEGQFLIRIDQPWGEYQARGQHKLSPMQFADALIRAGMELSAINLEIGVGYSPLGEPVARPASTFRG